MHAGLYAFPCCTGGWGIPNSFLYWHWAMVPIYFFMFSTMFLLTTPLSPTFPWMTLVHKLLIWFNIWESLGLGVIHGPLHGKMTPPFQDWWYRMTPGAMKYNAPFMKKLGFNLSTKRSYLDVFIECFLTYAFGFYALLQPEVTPAVMFPVMLCSLYEFFFDYGQHLHDYGTQNLHCFVCCCFCRDHARINCVGRPARGHPALPELLLLLIRRLQARPDFPVHVHEQHDDSQVHVRRQVGRSAFSFLLRP